MIAYLSFPLTLSSNYLMK